MRCWSLQRGTPTLASAMLLVHFCNFRGVGWDHQQRCDYQEMLTTRSTLIFKCRLEGHLSSNASRAGK